MLVSIHRCCFFESDPHEFSPKNCQWISKVNQTAAQDKRELLGWDEFKRSSGHQKYSPEVFFRPVVVALKDLFRFKPSENLGIEMIQFDEHILQMGWNHQLVHILLMKKSGDHQLIWISHWLQGCIQGGAGFLPSTALWKPFLLGWLIFRGKTVELPGW